jgi:hypothetical protein
MLRSYNEANNMKATNEFEKPLKMQRLVYGGGAEPSTIYSEEKKSDEEGEPASCIQLQALVEELAHQSMYDYDDAVFENIHEALLTALTHDVDEQLLECLHGLLLQWLDFLATSEKPVADITVDDGEQNDAVLEAMESIFHVLGCLKLIYKYENDRIAVVFQLDKEVLFILIRCFTWVLGATEQQSSLCLRQVLEVLKHFLVNHNAAGDCLPLNVQQTFVLALLEVASAAPAVTDQLTTHVEGSTTGLDDAEIARSILETFADAGPLSGISEYAATALEAISTSVGSSSNVDMSSSSSDLFRTQCHLRCSNHVVGDENLVKSCCLIFKKTTCDSLLCHQAMDCLALMSRHCPTKIHAALMEALLHVLVTKGMSASLKFRAVEGLQLLFDHDDTSLACCMEILKSRSGGVDAKKFAKSLLKLCCVFESFRYSSIDSLWSGHVRNNGLLIGAAELLLSCIGACLEEGTDESPLSFAQIVSLCTRLIDMHHDSCEHIAYLTVRVVCCDHRQAFLDGIVADNSHHELLCGLGHILKDKDTTANTKCAILTFYQDLVILDPMVSSILVRQEAVLSAITSVACSQEDVDVDHYTCKLAIQLLFLLSDDVCNRRILVKSTRVLSSMIHFLRNFQRSQSDEPPLNDAEEMKERVQQLASVL